METPARYTFSPDGSTNVFQIPVQMKGDNYVRIDINDVTLNDRNKFDIVNNSIVFVDPADVPAGSKLDILVVQTDEGISNLGNINSIDLVSQHIPDINTVAADIASVNTNAANIGVIQNVSTNMTGVLNAVASASNAAASEAAAQQASTDAIAASSSASTSASQAAGSLASVEAIYDTFDDRYLGAKTSDPSLDNDGQALITGALYFDSANGVTKVFDGAQWAAAASSIDGIKSVFSFSATAGQTAFSGNGMVMDRADLVGVYMNGIRLPTADFSVNLTGNTVTLNEPAALGDTLDIEVFGNFAGQSGAEVGITGGTITGLDTLSVDGPTFITDSNSTPLMVNRTGADGGIVDFRKDGSTVGSIGSNAGAHLIMGNGDTGLLFNAATDKIHPWNMSTQGIRDNAVDLGVDVSRFKDLYLSGGVYLGGTGAANHLDDYEEGDWTPTMTGATTGTYNHTTQYGRYVKVGDMVTVTWWVVINSSGTATGALVLSGLPFAARAGVRATPAIRTYQFSTGPGSVTAYISGASALGLQKYTSGMSGATINVDCTEFTTATGEFGGSLTYHI